MDSSSVSLAVLRLRPAIVLSTAEATCTVFAQGRKMVVPYASFFPEPRSERVAPGHLVAVATVSDSSQVVVWRWFDAVIVDAADGMVTLWEPLHGSVEANPRDVGKAYRPGGRAYLSAGLPGAKWWVAGTVVDRAEDADIDLDEVERFLMGLGLWSAPAGHGTP